MLKTNLVFFGSVFVIFSLILIYNNRYVKTPYTNFETARLQNMIKEYKRINKKLVSDKRDIEKKLKEQRTTGNRSGKAESLKKLKKIQKNIDAIDLIIGKITQELNNRKNYNYIYYILLSLGLLLLLPGIYLIYKEKTPVRK